MIRLFRTFSVLLSEWLQHPLRVLALCLGLSFFSLVVEGSLLQLWSLHRDYDQIRTKRLGIEKSSSDLVARIHQASDPGFLEFEALNRFDLAEEGDLIFVFSEDSQESAN